MCVLYIFYRYLYLEFVEALLCLAGGIGKTDGAEALCHLLQQHVMMDMMYYACRLHERTFAAIYVMVDTMYHEELILSAIYAMIYYDRHERMLSATSSARCRMESRMYSSSRRSICTGSAHVTSLAAAVADLFHLCGHQHDPQIVCSLALITYAIQDFGLPLVTDAIQRHFVVAVVAGQVNICARVRQYAELLETFTAGGVPELHVQLGLVTVFVRGFPAEVIVSEGRRLVAKRTIPIDGIIGQATAQRRLRQMGLSHKDRGATRAFPTA